MGEKSVKSPCHLPFPPFPNIPIDLRVEEDQQDEWNDSEDDETSPIEVNRIVWIHPELGDVEDDAVLGDVAQVQDCRVAFVDGDGDVGGVEEFRQVSGSV